MRKQKPKKKANKKPTKQKTRKTLVMGKNKVVVVDFDSCKTAKGKIVC